MYMYADIDSAPLAPMSLYENMQAKVLGQHLQDNFAADSADKDPSKLLTRCDSRIESTWAPETTSGCDPSETTLAATQLRPTTCVLGECLMVSLDRVSMWQKTQKTPTMACT